MVGQKVTDPTSGFRAVNRDVIRLFARYYPHDYPEVEAIVLLARRGFRISETPCSCESVSPENLRSRRFVPFIT